MSRYVIIGAGAAGLKAAETIRKNNSDDTIFVISPEDIVYSRSLLHYYLGRQREKDQLSFVSKNFFKKTI